MQGAFRRVYGDGSSEIVWGAVISVALFVVVILSVVIGGTLVLTNHGQPMTVFLRFASGLVGLLGINVITYRLSRDCEDPIAFIFILLGLVAGLITLGVAIDTYIPIR